MISKEYVLAPSTVRDGTTFPNLWAIIQQIRLYSLLICRYFTSSHWLIYPKAAVSNFNGLGDNFGADLLFFFFLTSSIFSVTADKEEDDFSLSGEGFECNETELSGSKLERQRIQSGQMHKNVQNHLDQIQ